VYTNKSQFSLTHSSLYASARGTYKDTNPLANITVLGVSSAVKSVSLNGAAVASNSWSYDSSSKVLEVKGLNGATSAGAWSKDWVLKWS
jgi:alpha-glucosidase